ncbi:IclR family transcriptional regulator [Actinacidiphila oryziradicis]|uniref:Glycerol operon regulatory protein n=1 Tax=Actinacidiphila oryziradicis TaxID=2571141 RepID=A0A4U0SLK3_9ACTN|nr:IclR family transcriptional regulator [Actinacidiphila oryziradicis]TKA01185.1 IclR family transcriptional regulator [Actinacidiphila oryziradicis]
MTRFDPLTDDAQGAANTHGPTAPVATVKSADRTIDVLELLASAPRRLTLSEIHRELGVPKSSLHNLLQTLVARSWLETDERNSTYAIGMRALRAGASYLERDPVIEAAWPLLTHLRDELNETVHLARLDGSDIVYLASRESAHHLRSSSRIGRRLPAHTTGLGKALLAVRTDEEVAALLPQELRPLTPDTVTDLETLIGELNQARRDGYIFERAQNTPGLGCFAVVISRRQPAIDALSCSVPLVRLTDEHRMQIVSALVHAAEELRHVTPQQAR